MKKVYFLLVGILLLAQPLTPSLRAFSQEPQKTQESAELAEAKSLNETVKRLFKEEKYKEALPLARRVLEIREQLLPANDPWIEASLTLLGDVQLALEDYGDTKKTYQRLLQRQEQRLGTNAGNLTPTLDRLCIVSFRDRNYSEAEQACMRSLAIKELSFGPNHPDVGHSLFLLAEQYRLRRNADRAAPLYLRAISIYGELPGEQSPKFQRVREGFFCLCHQSRKPELFKELETIEKKYAPTPTDPTVVTESRILNGRALTLPKPEYSAAARSRGEEGMVVVKVVIDETGKVISAVDMCYGPPGISYASVKSALSARFAPTRLSGMPVRVYGFIYYNFVLR
jgi:tetratricopeptide (TPR) repeat protein